jgi:hypothetical protein
MAMSNPELLEREIVQAVRSLPDRSAREGWGSDRRWTVELVAALGELGRQQKFDVCASGWSLRDGHCWGEWLYDLSWLEMKDGHVIDVPMILESEWNLKRDEIEADFGKLLLGRADRRVMVFQQPNAAKVDEIVSYLKECIAKFKRTAIGDRYMFLGYDIATKSFRDELFVVP